MDMVSSCKIYYKIVGIHIIIFVYLIDFSLIKIILNFKGESYTRRADQLKAEVRRMFHTGVDPSEKLELIDILQKLGLSYHFEDEVKMMLEAIYNNTTHRGEVCKEENLYATSLEFRLLRQHGYSVPQGIYTNNFHSC